MANSQVRLARVAVLFALLLSGVPSVAYAHKLNLFATVEGRTIQGKVYFRGGTPARDTAVRAFDPAGQEIGHATTDGEGRFTLDAKFRCDYRLVVDTGDGHGADYVLPAAALPADLPVRETPAGAKASAPAPAVHEHPHPEDSSPAVHEHSPAAAPPDAVAAQLDLLRTEIVRLEEQLNAYEDRLRWSDVLGGIGYILGVTGAAYYYFGTRKKRDRS